MTTRCVQVCVSPIAEAYKSQASGPKPCSKRDWEHEEAKPLGVMKQWDSWKPRVAGHVLKRGDFFVALSRKTNTRPGRADVFKISGIHTPASRPAHWGNNIGQRDRNVIDIGERVCTFSWAEWQATGVGGCGFLGTSRVAGARAEVLAAIQVRVDANAEEEEILKLLVPGEVW